MRSPSRILAALLASSLLAQLAGCGTLGGKASASASLAPTGAISPNPTVGNVTFTALDHGVRVAGEVRGFAPGTEHGSPLPAPHEDSRPCRAVAG